MMAVLVLACWPMGMEESNTRCKKRTGFDLLDRGMHNIGGGG